MQAETVTTERTSSDQLIDLSISIPEAAHNNWLRDQETRSQRVLWHTREPLTDGKSGHPWLVPFHIAQDISRNPAYSRADLLDALRKEASNYPRLYSTENLKLLEGLSDQQFLSLLDGIEVAGISANDKWIAYGQYMLQLAGIDSQTTAVAKSEIASHARQLGEIEIQLQQLQSMSPTEFVASAKLPAYESAYKLMILAHHNWRAGAIRSDKLPTLTSAPELTVSQSYVRSATREMYSLLTNALTTDTFNPYSQTALDKGTLLGKINQTIKMQREIVENNPSVNAATSWEILLQITKFLNDQAEYYTSHKEYPAFVAEAFTAAAMELTNTLKADANPLVATTLLEAAGTQTTREIAPMAA